MRARELNPTGETKSSESREHFNCGRKNESLALQHGFPQTWLSHGAGRVSPQDRLASLSRLQGIQSVQRRNYVLHLQKRYGNRYVQRVLGQSRERESAGHVPIPDGGSRTERFPTGLARPALFGERSREKSSGVLPPAAQPVSTAAATPVVAVVPGPSAAPPSVRVQPPGPAPKAAAGAAPEARREEVPSAPGVQAPAVKPAAKPAAASLEKPIAGPAGAKVTAAGAAAKAAAPEATAAPSPHQAIAPAISAIRQRAAGARQHPPAAVPVASAQAAGINPKTEQTRAAAAQTVANLDADAAKAEKVKRDEFKAKLKQAIEAATPQPKTEDQAEQVMKTGATNASKALRGQLATERDAATGPLKSTAATEVSPVAQPAPPQTELRPEQVGALPAPVSPAPVVPAPLPAERLDYSSDRAPTEQMMAENNVTQAQLEEGNDPAFGPALQARSTAEKHEATAEARYRQSESGMQNHAQMAAQQALTQGLTDLHGVRESRINKVVGQQLSTKSKNAAERQQVTDKINSIKDKTRADVNAILDEMETGATPIFEAGLKRAEEAYEDTFKEAKGGAWTWLTTWGSDWERLIERSLATARREYLKQVDKAIDEVADFVEAKLKAAKQRVADGRKAVDDVVKGLDDSLKQYGEEALQAVSADFDAMGTDIEQRRDGLIDKLAQQYKASYERMSAMEEKLREENKSLWQRVYDATVGIIKKIIAFKDMLLSVLAKAAEVVVDIIAHPIRFLGNLVSGIMQGLKNFMAKIGFYLQKGLMEWLFGALGATGLQLPDKFDLQGIISIVLQILGLTYANFRARAVAIVPEPVVAALEKTAEIFKVVITEGVPGLWRFIKEQLADLKSMVLDAIFDFIKERVIMAGITWIIGLLNPASAFFKACKAIYDIVVFFIERASQIAALVSAVVDSVAAIAKGALGTAITAVEGALARAIPVAIGFLASLLGLGDPTKPVRGFIEKARAPVNKAIDWVIKLAVKGVKAAGKFVGGLFGGKKEEKPEEKERRLDQAMTAAERAVARFSGRKVSARLLKPVLAGIRLRYGLKSLEPIARGKKWAISGEINPKKIKFISVEVEGIEVGEVPAVEQQKLEAKIKEQKDAYRKALSKKEWREHLGWCFEQAVNLGMTIIDAPKESVTLLLMEITPSNKELPLHPSEKESITGKRLPHLRWDKHYVILVNGRVFDYEARKQGLDLKTYLGTMFLGQETKLRVAIRQHIKSAAEALKSV